MRAVLAHQRRFASELRDETDRLQDQHLAALRDELEQLLDRDALMASSAAPMDVSINHSEL